MRDESTLEKILKCIAYFGFGWLIGSLIGYILDMLGFIK